MTKTQELIETIKNEPGIILVETIDNEIKKQILQHEMKRLDELVPFINQGMEEAFELEDALVIIMDNEVRNKLNITPKDPDNSSFTLRTESGQIVGETITDEEELEGLREDPNVYFLSDNFVTYSNLTKPGEKQFFVMTSTDSSFFTDKKLEDIVTHLKIAIPSTGTDNYIKDLYDIDHREKIGTLIIGFTE